MSTQTRNEAAERLRSWLKETIALRLVASKDITLLDEALAAERASERAATVERIRMEIRLSAFHANNPKLTKGWEELYQILDAELAR